MNAPATTIERAAKERPILFSGPLVRAILDGTKTQTRRIVKPQPQPYLSQSMQWGYAIGAPRPTSPRLVTWRPDGCPVPPIDEYCPYGAPGDRLWVRETWTKEGGMLSYRSDGDWIADYREGDPNDYGQRKSRGLHPCWRPSIHMPRWASRISLEVTGVRVERLQAISEADAQAEGVDGSKRYLGHGDFDEEFPSEVFAALWDAINGAGSWASNPWVWCVSFRRVEGR